MGFNPVAHFWLGHLLRDENCEGFAHYGCERRFVWS